MTARKKPATDTPTPAPSLVINCGSAGGMKHVAAEDIEATLAAFDDANSKADADSLARFQADQKQREESAKAAATAAAAQKAKAAELVAVIQQHANQGTLHPAIKAMGQLMGILPAGK